MPGPVGPRHRTFVQKLSVARSCKYEHALVMGCRLCQRCLPVPLLSRFFPSRCPPASPASLLPETKRGPHAIMSFSRTILNFLRKSKNGFTNMRSIRCLSPSSTQKYITRFYCWRSIIKLHYIFCFFQNRLIFTIHGSVSADFFLHYTIRLLSCKYEPLTQGNGLHPNHDGSSTERDVPNEFCVLRNKPL